MADHYETLGVERSASSAEIRKAYAQLARQHHPDRFQDPQERTRAGERFQAITEAFNTLSNDGSRRAYDAQLARPKLETPEELARDAFERANKSIEQRDYATAVELLKAAIHHAPGEPSYHVALARILARTVDRVREAVQAFESALALTPRSVPLHLELGRVLLDQGLKLRARKLLETAARLEPGSAKVQQLLAEAGGGSSEPDPPKAGGGLGNLFGRKR